MESIFSSGREKMDTQLHVSSIPEEGMKKWLLKRLTTAIHYLRKGGEPEFLYAELIIIIS